MGRGGKRSAYQQRQAKQAEIARKDREASERRRNDEEEINEQVMKRREGVVKPKPRKLAPPSSKDPGPEKQPAGTKKRGQGSKPAPKKPKPVGTERKTRSQTSQDRDAAAAKVDGTGKARNEQLSESRTGPQSIPTMNEEDGETPNVKPAETSNEGPVPGSIANQAPGPKAGLRSGGASKTLKPNSKPTVKKPENSFSNYGSLPKLRITKVKPNGNPAGTKKGPSAATTKTTKPGNNTSQTGATTGGGKPEVKNGNVKGNRQAPPKVTGKRPAPDDDDDDDSDDDDEDSAGGKSRPSKKKLKEPTLKELKKMCVERGIISSGEVEDLQERLWFYRKNGWHRLDKPTLIRMCKRRAIRSDGKAAILRERLASYEHRCKFDSVDFQEDYDWGPFLEQSKPADDEAEDKDDARAEPRWGPAKPKMLENLNEKPDAGLTDPFDSPYPEVFNSLFEGKKQEREAELAPQLSPGKVLPEKPSDVENTAGVPSNNSAPKEPNAVQSGNDKTLEPPEETQSGSGIPAEDSSHKPVEAIEPSTSGNTHPSGTQGDPITLAESSPSGQGPSSKPAGPASKSDAGEKTVDDTAAAAEDDDSEARLLQHMTKRSKADKQEEATERREYKAAKEKWEKSVHANQKVKKDAKHRHDAKFKEARASLGVMWMSRGYSWYGDFKRVEGAEGMGFRHVPVRGDGNCMWHAVAGAMHANYAPYKARGLDVKFDAGDMWNNVMHTTSKDRSRASVQRTLHYKRIRLQEREPPPKDETSPKDEPPRPDVDDMLDMEDGPDGPCHASIQLLQLIADYYQLEVIAFNVRFKPSSTNSLDFDPIPSMDFEAARGTPGDRQIFLVHWSDVSHLLYRDFCGLLTGRIFSTGRSCIPSKARPTAARKRTDIHIISPKIATALGYLPTTASLSIMRCPRRCSGQRVQMVVAGTARSQ